MTQTDKPSVAEMDIVIAQFDGWKEWEYEKGIWFHPERNKQEQDFEYHSSWDWLMPVVKKCHDISSQKQKEYPENKDLDDPTGWRSWSYRYVHLNTDIARVHKAVYDFILWYNQHHNRP